MPQAPSSFWWWVGFALTLIGTIIAIIRWYQTIQTQKKVEETEQQAEEAQKEAHEAKETVKKKSSYFRRSSNG